MNLTAPYSSTYKSQEGEKTLVSVTIKVTNLGTTVTVLPFFSLLEYSDLLITASLDQWPNSHLMARSE